MEGCGEEEKEENMKKTKAEKRGMLSQRMKESIQLFILFICILIYSLLSLFDKTMISWCLLEDSTITTP